MVGGRGHQQRPNAITRGYNVIFVIIWHAISAHAIRTKRLNRSKECWKDENVRKEGRKTYINIYTKIFWVSQQWGTP